MTKLKESRLAKMDIKKLHWMETLFLVAIFINLLSLIVNAIAGHLIWVIIAAVFIGVNIWFYETHETER